MCSLKHASCILVGLSLFISQFSKTVFFIGIADSAMACVFLGRLPGPMKRAPSIILQERHPFSIRAAGLNLRDHEVGVCNEGTTHSCYVTKPDYSDVSKHRHICEFYLLKMHWIQSYGKRLLANRAFGFPMLLPLQQNWLPGPELLRKCGQR